MSRHFTPSFFFTIFILFLDLDVLSVSASHSHIRRVDHRNNLNRLPLPPPSRLRRRKSCRPRNTTTSSILPSTKPTPSASEYTTTSTLVTPSTTSPTPSASPSSEPVVPIVGKPSDWPTATQAGAAPTATVTSAADPFLLELSKAYNNSQNPLFNAVYQGDMTYYGQGEGACGDTYDDSTFTAAVSMLMFDVWPGSSAAQNRNPICGPFCPGRKALNQAGTFEIAVKGSSFVNIGGDGRLNCDVQSQCHIPMTATVKHGGKSILVHIVDRCVGCKKGDIDLTPTAFGALADLSLGRTSVEWFFNNY